MDSLADALRSPGVIAGSLLAILTLLVYVYTKLLRPAWRYVRETMANVHTLLALADRELTPNSGASMKDAVCDLVTKVNEIMTAQRGSAELLGQHIANDDRVQADLADGLAKVDAGQQKLEASIAAARRRR